MNSPHKRLKSASPLTVLFLVTIGVGILSGLAGMCLDLLLHLIQHLAFRYSLTHLVDYENFLEGVTAAAPSRRFFVLTFCGFVAGTGWFLLYRYGKPLISISTAVHSKKPYMPIYSTTIHALLQIITVALGSPLGREVAPREISAMLACWLSAKAKLHLQETQIMMACAAGAGLAAVYNVPLGGAIFTLEVLMGTFNWSVAIPAFGTAGIATAVSWIGLGNVPQYIVPHYEISNSLLIWSIIASPVFGFAAYWFRNIALDMRTQAPKDIKLFVFCVLNFLLIGLLAMQFPALLGNGKGPIQLGFTDDLAIKTAFVLLVLRVCIVWSSLRAGAVGGLLTPSLANGVLLATVLGGLWSYVLPGTPLGAYAVVGAAAFLASSQKMPITAIVLTAEFTGINFNFLVPVIMAITGSIGTMRFYELCTEKERGRLFAK